MSDILSKHHFIECSSCSSNNQQNCCPGVLTFLIMGMTNYPLAQGHHTIVSLQTSNSQARLQSYTYLLICHHFVIHMTLHISTGDLLQGFRQGYHGCLGYLKKTLMKPAFNCLMLINKLGPNQNDSHWAENIFDSTFKKNVASNFMGFYHIHGFLWDVITYPYPNFNTGLLKLGHRWVIIHTPMPSSWCWLSQSLLIKWACYCL